VTAPAARPPALPVLVVDDNEEIRVGVREVLEDQGFRVVTAANGREALDLMGSQLPCLILLDLIMPPMDGWQFMSAQRSNGAFRDIPIVILSALAHKSESRTVGAAAVLGKPIDTKRLLEVVRAHCNGALRP